MLVSQSCLTLCDPMDSSPPGSSVHGILQSRILEGVSIYISYFLALLESLVYSMDMNLNKLWEIVKDRGARYTAVHGVTKSLV